MSFGDGLSLGAKSERANAGPKLVGSAVLTAWAFVSLSGSILGASPGPPPSTRNPSAARTAAGGWFKLTSRIQVSRKTDPELRVTGRDANNDTLHA